MNLAAEAPRDGRSLLLIAGSGRSGTSLLAGLMGRLGFHIPLPEVKADDSNPRGFGEPRWAVDFHKELLRLQNVAPEDGRPWAWTATEKVAAQEHTRRRLREWLEEQFSHGGRVVVKDPRLAWFLDLYLRTAEELGASVSVVTMLRHPAESIKSREMAYGTGNNAVTRTAGWLNMMLGTEERTRALPRAIVRFDDLLGDWRSALAAAEQQLAIPLAGSAPEEQLRHAGELVDVSLRRAAAGWPALALPGDVQALAQATYEALDHLALGEQPQEARLTLDGLRDRYVKHYENAESFARSSIRAARVEESRKLARQGGPGAGAAGAAKAGGGGLRRWARRLRTAVSRARARGSRLLRPGS
ncbi:MAG: sulfotransferase family protein [Gemmatimonadota bacterium]